MTNTISRTVAFRALNRRHAAESAAGNRFGTFFLLKSGAPSKKPTREHATEEAAAKDAAYLMSLNPGKTVVVLPLSEVR